MSQDTQQFGKPARVRDLIRTAALSVNAASRVLVRNQHPAFLLQRIVSCLISTGWRTRHACRAPRSSSAGHPSPSTRLQPPCACRVWPLRPCPGTFSFWVGCRSRSADLIGHLGPAAWHRESLPNGQDPEPQARLRIPRSAAGKPRASGPRLHPHRNSVWRGYDSSGAAAMVPGCISTSI